MGLGPATAVPNANTALAKIGENLPPMDGRLTRRFRNLRAGKANAFKRTSSRRLLTAGYPATAAHSRKFPRGTIVWRCRFRSAAAFLTPSDCRAALRLEKF